MNRPIEELVKEGEQLLALDNPVANAQDMADLIRDLLPVVKDAERLDWLAAEWGNGRWAHPKIPFWAWDLREEIDAVIASEQSATGDKS